MANNVRKGAKTGQHELPSGFAHTADSLAGGPGGTFIDRFGEPGDPAKKEMPTRGSGIVGKDTLTMNKFLRKK